ncbi:MAG: tetratricopeptide repeat protein [Chthoniobacteraceae bacterium]
MKRILLLMLAAAGTLVTSADAQSIVLQDGRRVTTQGLRRQGDTIMARDPLEEGRAAVNGEVGIPLSQIETLEFPEPAQLSSAQGLIEKGRGAEAVTQLDQALRYYEVFRDAPGSHWADLVLLKANILLALERDSEAEQLAADIVARGSDSETLLGAKAVLAACMVRRGEEETARPILTEVIRDAHREDTLATASVYQGECHLARKEFEPAILCFLTVPVFYPDQHYLEARWKLGAGRAFFAAGEIDRAKETLNELVEKQSAAPEVAAAKAELDRIARREKALDGPA